MKVCELCPATAEARGWMPAEESGRRLRMPADPARLELAERRDALVDRLTGQLATLEEELEQARGVREEADAAQAALAAAHAEIDRLTARLASTRNELEAALAQRRKDAEEIMQLKAALGSTPRGRRARTDRRSELDRVLRARERESNELELLGIAARAFNRSPHAERVREMAARQGRPEGCARRPRRRAAAAHPIAFAFGTSCAPSSSRSTSSPAPPASRAQRPTSSRRMITRGAGAPRAASSSPTRLAHEPASSAASRAFCACRRFSA